MSTKLNFGRDVQGYNAYAPTQATDRYSATLAANTATSITVPSNFENWIAVFSYAPGVEVWISMTGTAAVPAGGTFASTTSEMNPGARQVTAATVISAISAVGGDIGVSLYALS